MDRERVESILMQAANGKLRDTTKPLNENDSLLTTFIFKEGNGTPLTFESVDLWGPGIWIVGAVGAPYGGQVVGFGLGIEDHNAQPGSIHKIGIGQTASAILNIDGPGNLADDGYYYLKEVDIGKDSVFFKGNAIFSATVTGIRYTVVCPEIRIKRRRG
ncbi:hypothetical protein D3C76_138230 [compost metagenome]